MRRPAGQKGSWDWHRSPIYDFSPINWQQVPIVFILQRSLPWSYLLENTWVVQETPHGNTTALSDEHVEFWKATSSVRLGLRGR
jgi:hypothetical protein